MASEQEIARQRAAQARKSAQLRERATKSPLGDNTGSRRSTTSTAPAPKTAPTPSSTFSGGRTGLSASPGGLNVSPDELRAIQAAANAPAGTGTPQTIYIPGVGSVTVGQ